MAASRGHQVPTVLPKHAQYVRNFHSRRSRLRIAVTPPNDEVERRGAARASNEGTCASAAGQGSGARARRGPGARCKGGKDPVTVLPATLIAPLRDQLLKLFDRFERQRKLREPGMALPEALARKYPHAATEWGWQSVFRADSLCRDRWSGANGRTRGEDPAAGQLSRVSPIASPLICGSPGPTILNSSPRHCAFRRQFAHSRDAGYSVMRRL
jgi:hypothetical protein